MYEVKAKTSFDHHGSRRVGDKFKVGNKRQADELAKKDLVDIVGEASEKPADDEPKKAVKKTAKKAD